MASFLYSPSNAAQKTHEPKVLSAQFGDGYLQRVRDGIQTNPEQWEVTFANKIAAVADAIELFLSDHGGVNSFGWTPPNFPVERTYICSRWTRTYNEKTLHSISATFRQVYD